MNRWACIFRMGGVGDNLVAGSVLRPLKKLGYMTEMVTTEHAGAVFLNNPFVDKLSIKKDGEIPSAEWWKWFANRASEYDLLVNLSYTMEHRHAVRVSDAAFWWRPEYRRKLCAGSYLETAHDIVGVPHEFGPLFFPTEEERDKAAADKVKQFGGKYVLWVLAGSRIDKTHPYATHTIARIIKELGVTVVMMGRGDQQWEYANRVQTEVRRTNSSEEGLMLALTLPTQLGMPIEEGGPRHWGLRRSLATALQADVVVTPDSGIGWAVAMEPMPKVAMVSHASVDNITKHWVNTTTLHADPNRVPCWPCHQLHDSIDTCVRASHADPATAAACISDIKVEDIVDAVAQALRPKDNVVRLEAAE